MQATRLAQHELNSADWDVKLHTNNQKQPAGAGAKFSIVFRALWLGSHDHLSRSAK